MILVEKTTFSAGFESFVERSCQAFNVICLRRRSRGGEMGEFSPPFF